MVLLNSQFFLTPMVTAVLRSTFNDIENKSSSENFPKSGLNHLKMAIIILLHKGRHKDKIPNGFYHFCLNIEVECGVPHGEVLDPILFLLLNYYIVSLDNNGKICLFVDITSLHTTLSNDLISIK